MLDLKYLCNKMVKCSELPLDCFIKKFRRYALSILKLEEKSYQLSLAYTLVITICDNDNTRTISLEEGKPRVLLFFIKSAIDSSIIESNETLTERNCSGFAYGKTGVMVNDILEKAALTGATAEEVRNKLINLGFSIDSTTNNLYKGTLRLDIYANDNFNVVVVEKYNDGLPDGKLSKLYYSFTEWRISDTTPIVDSVKGSKTFVEECNKASSDCSYNAWISMNDKWPNYEESVLVLFKDSVDPERRCGVYHLETTPDNTCHWVEDTEEELASLIKPIRAVTHWCRLPNMPDTNKVKE